MIFLNLWTLPNLTDHMNSWPRNKIHNASQQCLSQDFFDVETILGWPGRSSEPFVTDREFPAPSSVSYKDAESSISVFLWPLLFVLYLFSWTIVIMVLPVRVNHTERMWPCFFIWWWATHGSLEQHIYGKLGHDLKAGQTIHPLVTASIK